MEDERNVPFPVSVYKIEVWHHLGFCGNVRLGSATCRAFARGEAGGIGSPRGCSFLSCWGVLCHWGGARVAVSARNINTNWKTCEIQVERFWECSTYVCIYFIFFTIVLFSLGILQALYLSRCNFLFRSKCYDIVCHNCKLKLLNNIYGLFIKYILYIYI